MPPGEISAVSRVQRVTALKISGKTADEEDYQLESSAGHCMYHSTDVEDSPADTDEKCQRRQYNLHHRFS